ncbi:DUF4344 domain-containing metallopeptidase [Nonomuraea sediminis]|uniref:DUF4344 domain-containing metallopeptidase n=1 Tax=Nonomuraea sediminis TaxID=2835864 RepID=UPI001BDC226B|nr:DUF4344 domain-containing metallopeptidase [Nonomuraea sediminis]
MKGRLLVAGAVALALSACGNGPLPMSDLSGAHGLPSASASGPKPSGTAAPSGSAPSPSPGSTGRYAFVPDYDPPDDRSLLAGQKLMKDNHLLEDWAQTANDGFIPPANIPINAEQCDSVNALYDPDSRSIVICYEMIDYLLDLFRKPEKGEKSKPSAKEVDKNVVGAMNGIFYHELGHGLIDLYDLPATGREEDAVDQLSALVLIQGAEDQDDYTDIISTIETWGRMSQTEPVDKRAFADEHSLSMQRYYNMMCYLYGSNHNAFLQLVSDGELPVSRAQRCEEEYRKMAHAWSTLLDPHLRKDLPSASASPSPAEMPSPTGSVSPSRLLHTTSADHGD